VDQTHGLAREPQVARDNYHGKVRKHFSGGHEVSQGLSSWARNEDPCR